jgi:hypothetical protein
MLALGASNLSLTTDSTAELASQALTHRVKAVALLNKALSRPATTKEEADARFAAFMNLTFQSTCMVDGLIDFFTMLRGCILQGDLGECSAFVSFFKDHHLETMETKIDEMQWLKLEDDALGEGEKSLAALEPFCQNETDRCFHTYLTGLVSNAYSSPKAGELRNPIDFTRTTSNKTNSIPRICQGLQSSRCNLARRIPTVYRSGQCYSSVTD